MKDRNSTRLPDGTADEGPEAAFASNVVRLGPRPWVVVACVVAVAVVGIPAGWKRIEPLKMGADYRIPFALGYDYWHYDRCCDEVCRGEKTLLLGDSVVWGHYVDTAGTLSHDLNEVEGAERFANLGVDGIHPVAMAGLIDLYGGAIRDKDVILHCNLLWMSSPRRDLQSEKETQVNHPELLPQFATDLPCYREPVSKRLSIVVGHRVPLFGWAKHLQIAYFDSQPLARWSLDHPYEDPVSTITLEQPSPDDPPSPTPDARPWTDQGIGKFNPPWVELDTSRQWRAFRQTVDALQERGNRVFVLVGPLNEHMLTERSLATYRQRVAEVQAWLEEQGIAHFVPQALPSEQYADASHPLAEGYARLAKELFEWPAFVEFHAGR